MKIVLRQEGTHYSKGEIKNVPKLGTITFCVGVVLAIKQNDSILNASILCQSGHLLQI